MDGSSSSPKDRSHSVHLSTIQRVNLTNGEASNSTQATAEAGAGQKNSVFLTAIRDYDSYTHRQDDVFSEDATITSSECVPTLEQPQPVFRSSSKAHFLDRSFRRAGAYPCSTYDLDRSDGQAGRLAAQIWAKSSLDDRTNDVPVTSSRTRRWSA
ncbi:unnamed protein product [Rhizoctonia solani]|uniref:Uncharacterized protein n=1 Tax=Rhizoctonia solani TaxID=456999 RepID=A0A8H3BFW3_9AGAM|nr:unnamed protein product [Rhizoctonia solani]